MTYTYSNLSFTELRYKHLRFLITDSPNDDNIQAFVEVRTIGLVG